MKTNTTETQKLAAEIASEYRELTNSIQVKTARLVEIKAALTELKNNGEISENIECEGFKLSFQPGRTTHIYPQSVVDAMDEAKSLGLTEKKQGPGFWKICTKKMTKA